MLKELLEEFKIQKKVSKEEYNIIKKILLKYFEDGREYAKRHGKASLPFRYVKDFGNGRKIEIARDYTSGSAIWDISCDCEDCDTHSNVRLIPNYNITDLIEEENLEKIEKFIKEVIKEFPHQNINCDDDKWKKFIKGILEKIK